jgi:type I restriction enzyme, S subunit
MSRWKTVTLGEVASIERSVVESSEIENGTLYVGLENIASGGALTGVRPVANGELASSKFKFTERHILFGKLRPYLAKIARPTFAGVCSTDILPILPSGDLDRAYLAHFLLQPSSVAWANARATGANLPRLSPGALSETLMPLPPVPVQRRIADVLDRAEALRAKRRASLARLDDLQQAIFLNLFGDPVTNPRPWPQRIGESVCTRITVGVVVKPASYYRPEGVPALRSLNVRPGKIVTDDVVYFSPVDNETRLAKSRLREGDVVVVRTGQPGTAAVIPAALDGANAIDIIIATPDRTQLLPEYLCAFLNSDGGKRIVLGAQRGQVQQHFNVGSLNAALIPVPQLALQKEFSAHLASLERLRGVLQRSLDSLTALANSLQERAFSGQL